MSTLEPILDITSYVASFAVMFFLITYSKYYNWYRSPLGMVMNLSLVFSALLLIGVSVHDIYYTTGTILMVIGSVGFTLSLIVRGALLTISAINVKRNRKKC